MKETISESQYVNVAELERYLMWHDLDCTKTSRELTRELSAALGRVVALKTLVCAALFQGYAAVPQRSHITFCRVQVA